MANVVELAAASGAALSPSYRRIRIASRGLEALFALLCAGWVAFALYCLWVLFFYQGTEIAVGPRGFLHTTGPLPPDYLPFKLWRLDQKLAYVPVAVVRSAPPILRAWFLSRLFRLYGQGQVFTARNTTLIKYIGVCLIADAVAPFLCHLALSATGYEIDRAWAHGASVEQLIQGAVVFFIALVMEAGREIEEDRKGFV